MPLPLGTVDVGVKEPTIVLIGLEGLVGGSLGVSVMLKRGGRLMVFNPDEEV